MVTTAEAPVRDAVEAVERWFKAPVLGVASPVAAATAAAAAARITNSTGLLEKNKGVRKCQEGTSRRAAGAVAEAAAST